MRGILAGVDRSGHSAKALEWAAREAAVHEVPLTVLTVYQIVVGYSGYVIDCVGDAERSERARREAQERVDKVLAGLDEPFRPESVTVRGVAGLPADELLTASAGADMIVVGARGAGGFRKLRLGSVASQVAHHAHVPVVIIPADKI